MGCQSFAGRESPSSERVDAPVLTLQQSAGPTMKKAAYGVGLIGLLVSACLYLHVSLISRQAVELVLTIDVEQVAAKYLFVRILRDSKHLQANTLIHWGTWM